MIFWVADERAFMGLCEADVTELVLASAGLSGRVTMGERKRLWAAVVALQASLNHGMQSPGETAPPPLPPLAVLLPSSSV